MTEPEARARIEELRHQRDAAAEANDTATVLSCRVEIGKLTAHIRHLQQEACLAKATEQSPDSSRV